MQGDSTVTSEPNHIDCDWLIANPAVPGAQRNMRIGISGTIVESIEPLPDRALASAAHCRLLALPALSNAHDHGRTFRNSTLGSFGLPLESWLPYMGVVPALDPYLCAATSLARSARNGVANVMVHYTRAQGGMPYVDETRAVAKAASDVGVRVGFAIAMRDRNGIAYCEDSKALDALRPGIRAAVSQRMSVRPVSPDAQVALVDEVAQMVASEGHGAYMNVQYGPTAVQWCSTPLLEAIARASADTGRRVHMHLLETRYQREWADATHPEGIVTFLDQLGLLSPRLTLAHCVWARTDELALLAERGVTMAVNTSSNLGLKSGIAPVGEMLKQGCRVAMGLDAGALDEDDDAFRELRLGYFLHRGWGFDIGMTRAQLWSFAVTEGAASINNMRSPSSGHIVKGTPADIVVLDWDAIDDESLFDDVDPFDLVLARAKGAHVSKMFVSGRLVVDEGRVLGVDEPELRGELLGMARTRLASDSAHLEWRNIVKELSEDLSAFYKNEHLGGCC